MLVENSLDVRICNVTFLRNNETYEWQENQDEASCVLFQIFAIYQDCIIYKLLYECNCEIQNYIHDIITDVINFTYTYIE